MKKLNKMLLALMLVTVVFMTGCKNVTSTMSYSFTVDTGDQIKVTIKTNNGYMITSNVPFDIKKNSDPIGDGTFIYPEYYDEYIKVAKSDSNSTIIDEGTKKNYSYFMWNYDDIRYNCVIKIKDSNTAVFIRNNISEESAKEVLNRLDFELLK